MAVSFANIFMAEIETKIIQQSDTKPREWKRYIDDVFSLWDCDIKHIERFIFQANKFHTTIKFTAEISENKTTFLDTTVFKVEDSQDTPSWTSTLTTSRQRPSSRSSRFFIFALFISLTTAKIKIERRK